MLRAHPVLLAVAAIVAATSDFSDAARAPSLAWGRRATFRTARLTIRAHTHRIRVYVTVSLRAGQSAPKRICTPVLAARLRRRGERASPTQRGIDPSQLSSYRRRPLEPRA